MTDRTCYWDERGGICPHKPHEHCPNEFIEPCENQCELCKAETINKTSDKRLEQAIDWESDTE